jgi:beta-galactosidase/beta-glucuronidase
MNRPIETNADHCPRPQLVRPHWRSLDGVWEFALDRRARWKTPAEVTWERTILVPYAPETPRSGIGDTDFYEACWYRRRVTNLALPHDGRLLLHFAAVDWAADVWIDRVWAGRHEGGYTPFTIDVTDLARDRGDFEVVVRAEDDPTDLAKPRGKQDWERDPHSIWYPRTTGIWQTVWIERVPDTFIGRVRWTPSLERWELGLDVEVAGEILDGLRLGVKLFVNPVLLVHDLYAVLGREIHRRIALSDPGIDDYRNDLLWSPESPTLIHAELSLLDGDGGAIDRVRSYTALRAIGIQGDRIVLNGRPYLLRMVLDQGYWSETGLTAPDPDSLRRDVELVKAMGFNGVRKHQKLEDPRYLYWADHLGLLVWVEMPSAYRFTARSVARVTREWMDAVQRDCSHPCVMAWVPFNESWGVPNLPESEAERDWVRALYHLTKTFDPTRPVVGNDGWEAVATDIIGIHDYQMAEQMARRYNSDELRPRLFRRERPGGRMLYLEAGQPTEHPVVVSEFGGIAVCKPGDRHWGYALCESVEEFAEHFVALMRVVHSLEMLAGFCYTQFADTYQEANGLLYADRSPKLSLSTIRAAVRGPERQKGTPP